MIAAIVLAAGESRRMGALKALLPFGPQTVVESVVSAFTGAPSVSLCLVVLGHEAETVARALQGHAVTAVRNDSYRDGMLSSIQAGLRSLPAAAEAVLVSPVDQPGLRSETVEALIGYYKEDRSSLVVPAYAGRRGHPLLLVRADVAPVLALSPAAALRDYVRANVERLRVLAVDDPATVRDIDDPDAYRRAVGERPES